MTALALSVKHMRIVKALAHLREARELLAAAGAPQAAQAVRRALKSTDGARRHAERCPLPSMRRASR